MAASTDEHEPSRATVAEAASWLAHLSDEDCTPADRDAFATWVAAAPGHRIAAERMGIIADRMEAQPPAERAALHRLLERSPVSTRPLAILLAVGGITALGWWGVHDPGVRARIADQHTPPGVQRQVALAAGDVVTLDGDTALDVDGAARVVTLWRGAVMAEVAHGRSQPFLVRTPQGSARAMGTRYSVRIVGDRTVVTVIASEVEACARMGDRRCIRLKPGQVARLDAGGVASSPDVDTLAADAWAHGLLYADDRPLGSVVDELNRYAPTPIVVDPKVRDLRLSGSFPLTDPDRALASIAAALPVAIERQTGEVVVRPKRKS